MELLILFRLESPLLHNKDDGAIAGDLLMERERKRRHNHGGGRGRHDRVWSKEEGNNDDERHWRPRNSGVRRRGIEGGGGGRGGATAMKMAAEGTMAGQ